MSRQYIYGFHAVKQHLKSQPDSCVTLLCLPSKNKRLLDIIQVAKKHHVTIAQKNKEQLEQLTKTEKHQGCVLEINTNATLSLSFSQLLEEVNERSLILILDEVQDPHNLGACLRTADATGVNAVIIPTDNAADMSSPIVSKVAAGGAETVPLIKVTNLARALKDLRKAGVWLVGTTGDTNQSLYETNFKGATGLVMGAEGSGMRRLTTENCDELIMIPMLGQVESLNVSVATGVCLFEINRQRMTNN
ncbi:MAG: 23S rRNA (guanosine(2251)-2'-O)-methyltransferase RlmB [Gammaproteobacteria bacterium]|nr:23S rRNA (guanosine(2251)-2'-O)-methyltransferase RlmB [Gammaproteobacteria bacterium]